MVKNNNEKKFRFKTYYKVKIDGRGEPYFVSQDTIVNTLKPNDMKTILDKYIKDEKTVSNIIEEMKEHIVIEKKQIRFAGEPNNNFILQSLVDIYKDRKKAKQTYEVLKKVFNRLSTATIEVQDKEGNKKIGPVAVLVEYVYY